MSEYKVRLWLVPDDDTDADSKPQDADVARSLYELLQRLRSFNAAVDELDRYVTPFGHFVVRYELLPVNTGVPATTYAHD